MVLQITYPFLNRYEDRRWDKDTRMCLCFSSGGVQQSQKTRSYYTYSVYSTYYTYFAYSGSLSDCCTAWLDACQSTIVYERRESSQVLYVIPVSSILGRLPLVPVGNTGTIPYEMQRESANFEGSSCDKTKKGKDGCRWWNVNS